MRNEEREEDLGFESHCYGIHRNGRELLQTKNLASATRARRSVALSGKPAIVPSREFDHVGHVWQVPYVTRSSDSIGHVRRHCEERIQHNGQRECKNSRDCAICLNRLVFIRAIKEALDESTVTLISQYQLVELNGSSYASSEPRTAGAGALAEQPSNEDAWLQAFRSSSVVASKLLERCLGKWWCPQKKCRVV